MDKLLILRAGRVEAFGPPSDVLIRVVKSARVPEAPQSPDRSAAQTPPPLQEPDSALERKEA
jgi:ABC-type protease/lipase transport system fused ATPase/permease subunit